MVNLSYMLPSRRAIEIAESKVIYATEKDGQHIVTVFGTRFCYTEQLSAMQAQERMVILLSEVLEEYAAEVQALNSWDPLQQIKGSA